jgi:hypothetical protein
LHTNEPSREQHVSFGAVQHTPAQHCRLDGQQTLVTVPSVFGLWQTTSPLLEHNHVDPFGRLDGIGVATFTHRPLTQACVNVQN